jgi:hypothetical protein
MDGNSAGLTCAECGQHFEPSRKRKRQQTYCSRRCSGMAIRVPVEIRLQAKSILDPMSGCLLWTGCLNASGYGTIGIEGKSKLAHVVAFRTSGGTIPDGYQIDHLCRTRACIDPAHMEPVTPRENWRRGQSVGARAIRTGGCGRGHLFDEGNTYIEKGGSRKCITCTKMHAARRSARRRAAITHCPHGHAYAEDGYVNVSGIRVCSVCRRRKRAAA